MTNSWRVDGRFGFRSTRVHKGNPCATKNSRICDWLLCCQCILQPSEQCILHLAERRLRSLLRSVQSSRGPAVNFSTAFSGALQVCRSKRQSQNGAAPLTGTQLQNQSLCRSWRTKRTPSLNVAGSADRHWSLERSGRFVCLSQITTRRCCLTV
jgi:hypothetical protein